MGSGGGAGWLFLNAKGRGWLDVGFEAFFSWIFVIGSMIGVVLLKDRDRASEGRTEAARGVGSAARSCGTNRESALLMVVLSWRQQLRLVVVIV